VEGDVDAGLLGDRRIEVAVEVDDRNLHFIGVLEAGQKDRRIDRRGDHHRRFLLEHRIAGVELRLGRLVGFDRLQEDVDVRLLCAFVDALLHRAPERVRQSFHQDAVNRLVGGERARRREAERERGDRDASDAMFQHVSLPSRS